MKKQYDFSNGKRGAVVSPKGKTRVTIWLDDDVIAEARKRAEAAGVGYQTAINTGLREHLIGEEPVSASAVRLIIREELSAASIR
jgi:uncharacterized protein (DUF4415 family)